MRLIYEHTFLGCHVCILRDRGHMYMGGCAWSSVCVCVCVW